MITTRAQRSLALMAALALTASAVMVTGGAVAAKDDAKFCKDTNIVFFPGGTQGGPFETVVANGAKAAEAAFGPKVQYVWSDWDPAKMITQFGEAVATNPDGIAVMGHPGDDAFKPLIDDAVANGIIVTVMNTELPATEAAHATQGTGYVGAVLYKAGGDLAREAITRGGLQAGDKVFLWGLEAQPGRGERTLGIHDALTEAGMDVIYLEIDDATNADPSAGISTFTGMASANPELKAAFFDHGNVTSTAQAYLEAAGIAPDAVYVAGFDLAPATIAAIQSGYVDLAIDQQQWLQGFEAVAQICLTHNYGFSGLKIDTGGGFVDASNIDMVAPLVEQQIR
jgi:simple sugar transport system substrate-binding protein